MLIRVDSREPESILTLLLQENLEYEICTLEIGDYQYQNIVVERKEIEDFRISIMEDRKEGRYWRQLLNMKNLENSGVFIHGNFNEYEERSRNAMLAAMISTYVRYGIPVFFSENEEQFVYLMKKFFEKSTDGKGITHYTHFKKNIDNNFLKKCALSTPMKSSMKIAEKVLEQFNYKISKICETTEKELTEIPGIGKKIAENIKKIFD